MHKNCKLATNSQDHSSLATNARVKALLKIHSYKQLRNIETQTRYCKSLFGRGENSVPGTYHRGRLFSKMLQHMLPVEFWNFGYQRKECSQCVCRIEIEDRQVEIRKDIGTNYRDIFDVHKIIGSMHDVLKSVRSHIETVEKTVSQVLLTAENGCTQSIQETRSEELANDLDWWVAQNVRTILEAQEFMEVALDANQIIRLSQFYLRTRLVYDMLCKKIAELRSDDKNLVRAPSRRRSLTTTIHVQMLEAGWQKIETFKIKATKKMHAILSSAWLYLMSKDDSKNSKQPINEMCLMPFKEIYQMGGGQNLDSCSLESNTRDLLQVLRKDIRTKFEAKTDNSSTDRGQTEDNIGESNKADDPLKGVDDGPANQASDESNCRYNEDRFKVNFDSGTHLDYCHKNDSDVVFLFASILSCLSTFERLTPMQCVSRLLYMRKVAIARLLGSWKHMALIQDKSTFYVLGTDSRQCTPDLKNRAFMAHLNTMICKFVGSIQWTCYLVYFLFLEGKSAPWASLIQHTLQALMRCEHKGDWKQMRDSENSDNTEAKDLSDEIEAFIDPEWMTLRKRVPDAESIQKSLLDWVKSCQELMNLEGDALHNRAIEDETKHEIKHKIKQKDENVHDKLAVNQLEDDVCTKEGSDLGTGSFSAFISDMLSKINSGRQMATLELLTFDRINNPGIGMKEACILAPEVPRVFELGENEFKNWLRDFFKAVVLSKGCSCLSGIKSETCNQLNFDQCIRRSVEECSDEDLLLRCSPKSSIYLLTESSSRCWECISRGSMGTAVDLWKPLFEDLFTERMVQIVKESIGGISIESEIERALNHLQSRFDQNPGTTVLPPVTLVNDMPEDVCMGDYVWNVEKLDDMHTNYIEDSFYGKETTYKLMMTRLSSELNFRREKHGITPSILSLLERFDHLLKKKLNDLQYLIYLEEDVNKEITMYMDNSKSWNGGEKRLPHRISWLVWKQSTILNLRREMRKSCVTLIESFAECQKSKIARLESCWSSCNDKKKGGVYVYQAVFLGRLSRCLDIHSMELRNALWQLDSDYRISTRLNRDAKTVSWQALSLWSKRLYAESLSAFEWLIPLEGDEGNMDEVQMSLLEIKQCSIRASESFMSCYLDAYAFWTDCTCLALMEVFEMLLEHQIERDKKDRKANFMETKRRWKVIIDEYCKGKSSEFSNLYNLMTEDDSKEIGRLPRAAKEIEMKDAPHRPSSYVVYWFFLVNKTLHMAGAHTIEVSVIDYFVYTLLNLLLLRCRALVSRILIIDDPPDAGVDQTIVEFCDECVERGELRENERDDKYEMYIEGVLQLWLDIRVLFGMFERRRISAYFRQRIDSARIGQEPGQIKEGMRRSAIWCEMEEIVAFEEVVEEVQNQLRGLLNCCDVEQYNLYIARRCQDYIRNARFFGTFSRSVDDFEEEQVLASEEEVGRSKNCDEQHLQNQEGDQMFAYLPIPSFD